MSLSPRLDSQAPKALGGYTSTTLLRDMIAGAVAASVTLAYAMSYAALMLPAPYNEGAPTALWALMIGATVVGVIVGYLTTIQPVASGADGPQSAAMIVLSNGIAVAVSQAGGTPELAAQHALMALTLVNFVFALVLLTFGTFGIAHHLRLVPYAVVAGFLIATGCLLIAAGFKLATGVPLASVLYSPIPAVGWNRLALAMAFVVLATQLKPIFKSPFLIPGLMIIGAALINLTLLSNHDTLSQATGWYLAGIDKAKPWFPLTVMGSGSFNADWLWRTLPEALAIAFIGVISIIIKVVGIETQRSASSNLDAEFRNTGLASLLATACGGFASSIVVGSTRLLTEAGSITRMSGVFSALLLGAIILFGIDFPSVIPVPILAGLVLLVGINFILDSSTRIINQRDWGTLVFALIVAFVCVRFSFIAGILSGFVGSCLLFAASYNRIGLVRRTATRASVASDVDHGQEAMAKLRALGDQIHIYWLSGYIFFGSSEVIFERVRDAKPASPAQPIRYVVLDFTGVTGADASAVVSLVKLKNVADRRAMTLVLCGLSLALEQSLARDKFVGGKSRHRFFPTQREGLEWCELELLKPDHVQLNTTEVAQALSAPREEAFMSWLDGEFGGIAPNDVLAQYFERRNFDKTGVLYEQGSPADAIDFIVSGRVTISIIDASGTPRRLRRMCERTVVGEMGFFRARIRTATVSIEQPAVLFTLSRESFERMKRANPELATAFVGFIVRTLADRLEFANREIAAFGQA
jgi:sulfate permease, SulP family